MDVEHILSLPSGKRFLWRILETSGIHTPAYSADGRDLAYREGRRSLGLDILGWLGAVQPDALIRILTEELATQKETTSGRRSNAPDPDTDDADA